MKVLFQGDSVTDCGRNRENCYDLAQGYPLYAAKALQEKFPNISFEFLNRGISGNRTCDLVDRLEADFIALQPDIVTILIGINDVWRLYDRATKMEDADFERYYRTVLEALKARTHAKIIVIEPFLLCVEDKPFRPELDPKIQIVRSLARQYADAYIAADGMFAEASIKIAPTHWAEDGVHPSVEGHKKLGGRVAQEIARFVEID